MEATRFDELPPVAAWRHRDARSGFEVVFLSQDAGGVRVEGQSTAVEEGEAWQSRYVIELDDAFRTRRAHVHARTLAGAHERTLEADGQGRWLVDGEHAAHLDGLHDVDLEASSFTNAFPVRRLALGFGERADAPAAYVRALDLRVERLEQAYERIAEPAPRRRFAYASPAFGFAAELVSDGAGLVLDYPGIAERVR